MEVKLSKINTKESDDKNPSNKNFQTKNVKVDSFKNNVKIFLKIII